MYERVDSPKFRGHRSAEDRMAEPAKKTGARVGVGNGGDEGAPKRAMDMSHKQVRTGLGGIWNDDTIYRELDEWR